MRGELPPGTASASCPSSPVPGVQSAAVISSLEGCLSGRGLARWLLVWIPLENPQETHINEPHLARGNTGCCMLACLPFLLLLLLRWAGRMLASNRKEAPSL